jgi:hypothetical protein
MSLKHTLTSLYLGALCGLTFTSCSGICPAETLRASSIYSVWNSADSTQTGGSAHPAVASYVEEQGTLSDVDAIIVFLNRDPLIAFYKEQQKTRRAENALLLYLQAVNSALETLNRYTDLLIAASCGGTSYLDRLLMPDVLRWLKPRQYFSPQALLRTPERASF